MTTKKEVKQLSEPSKNTPILYLSVVAIISIVAILVLRPDSDPVVVIGAVGALCVSLLGYLKQVETHELVNSRMSAAIESAVKDAIATGRRLGRLEAEKRTDALAKQGKK